MDITRLNINFDKKAINSYHDKYNEQCQCSECTLFRDRFPRNYPGVVSLLSNFGVNIDYPLEIMDNGFDDRKLKRRYCVYYCVKGELPRDKIEEDIEDITIILRNWDIANEAYANTGMDQPYFIIELLDIYISNE